MMFHSVRLGAMQKRGKATLAPLKLALDRLSQNQTTKEEVFRLVNAINKTIEDENNTMELRIKQLEQMKKGQELSTNFIEELVNKTAPVIWNSFEWIDYFLATYQMEILVTKSRNDIIVVTRPLIELGIRKATHDMLDKATMSERVSCYINKHLIAQDKTFMPDVQMNMREMEHCVDESAVLEELRNMHKTLFELPTDVVVANLSGSGHGRIRLVCTHDSAPFRTAYALITAKLQKQFQIPRKVLVMEPQFKPFCLVKGGRLLAQGEYSRGDG